MGKYVCDICGFVYDEAAGIPDAGIRPGTAWDALPAGWRCPLCGAAKADFTGQGAQEAPRGRNAEAAPAHTDHASPREMTAAALSAVFSNLARGCEKQYLPEEAEGFARLADYYAQRAEPADRDTFAALGDAVAEDLTGLFPQAALQADAAADRGTKRALTWSEKVSRVQSALLARYADEGDAMLRGARIWVCDICGFLFIGDTPPDICPICKVPRQKILEVQPV